MLCPRSPASFWTLTLASICLVAAAERAAAELTALEISTQPSLAIASEQDGERVLSAASGAVIQLQIVARHANGSGEDVTATGTTYSSLAPEIVQVSASGVLTFSAAPEPWTYRAGAIVIEHAGLSKLQGFDVVP